MRWRETGWLLITVAGLAQAGEAPLLLEGTAAYHRVRVPLAVQAQTRRADLGDIQVLNARGEPVPQAWVAEEPAAAETRAQSVPFFKAPAAASAVDASQQGGWIVDLRGVKGALLTLELDVSPNEHGVYGFVLEYGDDLQLWRTYQSAAQLLSLQHQGLRLEHMSFELGGLQARYLRLRPLPGSTPPPLAGVRVSSSTRHAAPAPLLWSDTIAPTQCTAQYCDYSLPRHLPLERLEWQLAAANTLAPVELLAQYDAADAGAPGAGPWRHRHHHLLHGPLHGLRHKTAPAPAEPAWHPLQRSTVYWLRLPEGEVRSPELLLGGGLVTKLRVQPTGGMVQLGAKPPVIRVGARAVSLVFLAREPAPYRLVWGGEVPVNSLTLTQLMPTRQAGDPLPAESATVQLAAPKTAAPASAAASTPAPEPAPVPVPSRKLWLWGVLLAALGLMGFMAWSLLRPAATKG